MTSTILPNSPRRFSIAIVASVLANLALWFSLSQLSVRLIAHRPPAVLEFSRVTMDEKHVIHPKIIKPKEIKKRIEQVKPKPPEPKKVVQPTPQPKKAPPPPPQGAHNRIVTAKAPTAASEDHSFVAPTGGNAPVGVPSVQQEGSGTTNTTKPPPAAPPAAPPPAPPVKQEAPPAPPPAQPAPAPAPPPVKPTGPSRDAEPTYKVDPTIPDSLLSQEFKKSVRVRVHILPDGTFTVELRQTCGNPDVDKLAIDALKRWKWKPKLVDGVPTEDTQTFRFEFEVR